MSSVILQPNLKLKHFYTATSETFECKNCSLFDPENVFSVKYHQRMAQGSSCPLCHFCASVYINSFSVLQVNVSRWLYILLDSPCVQRWHWASVWAWPWLWSGWWGSCWPGRCCNTCGRPAGRCPRGFLCAGRSPLSTTPGRKSKEGARGGGCVSGSFWQLFVTYFKYMHVLLGCFPNLCLGPG